VKISSTIYKLTFSWVIRFCCWFLWVCFTICISSWWQLWFWS